VSDKHPVKWVDQAMFEAAPIEKEGEYVSPKVWLVSATPDPLGAIAAACRMYKGIPTYSLADITDDERREYWEQVKKTHLKAPLEFVDLHFFIEGVTRSFTHQQVRQRTAVYAQESMRFAVKEHMADEVAIPPSIQGNLEAERLFKGTVNDIQEAYDILINHYSVPAEDARALLPHATTTRLNYKTNLRNLLEHAGNRLCTQAQFEWRAVFFGIVRAIATYKSTYLDWEGNRSAYWQWNLIASDGAFKPVCYQLGRCQFMANFDRQCTIRDRVEQNAAAGRPPSEWGEAYFSPGEIASTVIEPISDAEWLLDPTAGRRD